MKLIFPNYFILTRYYIGVVELPGSIRPWNISFQNTR